MSALLATAAPVACLVPVPPARPAPASIPEAGGAPPPAPPAAWPHLDPAAWPQPNLRSKFAAGVAIGKSPEKRGRSNSFASTFASPLSSNGSAAESSDEEVGVARTASGSPERTASGSALPSIESSLMKDLVVRNTFLEFPDEPQVGGDARRRLRSAPPLGRDGAAGDSIEPMVPPAAACPQSVPSVGSLQHGQGTCRPCAFVHTKGCANGPQCEFCHLCDADEKKRRQRAQWEEKRAAWRAWRKQERREAACKRRAAGVRQ